MELRVVFRLLGHPRRETWVRPGQRRLQEGWG